MLLSSLGKYNVKIYCYEDRLPNQHARTWSRCERLSQERERGTFPLRDAKIDLARRHVPVVVLFCSMLKKRDGEHDHRQLSLSNFYSGFSRTIFQMPRKYKTWETPKQIASNGMSPGIQDPQLLVRCLFESSLLDNQVVETSDYAAVCTARVAI